jgi:hypothetical protein
MGDGRHVVALALQVGSNPKLGTFSEEDSHTLGTGFAAFFSRSTSVWA